jgi:hypothetical protein
MAVLDVQRRTRALVRDSMEFVIPSSCLEGFVFCTDAWWALRMRRMRSVWGMTASIFWLDSAKLN